MIRPRVVMAGLGDSGVLTAIHLSRHAEVVGISSKPELVSGQELGRRLARPEAWERDYRVGFDRFPGLDRARTVHGVLTGLDLERRRVQVRLADGTATEEPYDVLVISTGVSNGFWRRPELQHAADVDAALADAHQRLAAASSIAVVGGGAAAVSSAVNLAAAWPHTRVDLYFPGERGLPGHHGKVWSHIRRRLDRLGVGVHPGHRAVLPDGAATSRIDTGPITWATGQPESPADAVLWAIGRVEPNTAWLPPELLDAEGFVRVEANLRVPGHPEIFAVGDVAATDPLRTSARNSGHRLVAHNVRAHLAGRSLRAYRSPQRRWGSVLGVQEDGLEVFAPAGQVFRLPAWSIETVLQPWIVRRAIYRGVRRPRND